MGRIGNGKKMNNESSGISCLSLFRIIYARLRPSHGERHLARHRPKNPRPFPENDATRGGF
jgi:hypothetical protein